jgi:hypothetical protein
MYKSINRRRLDNSMPVHQEHDTPMTATYVAVVVVEAVIIVLLWVLGRAYS